MQHQAVVQVGPGRAEDLAALEHDGAHASGRQLLRRREAGGTRTDDHHISLHRD